MKKLNKETNPLDNPNNGFYWEKPASRETTDAAEADFTELKSTIKDHFASEDCIIEEALQSPDIFLQRCYNLFAGMLIASREKPLNSAARYMADYFYTILDELSPKTQDYIQRGTVSDCLIKVQTRQFKAALLDRLKVEKGATGNRQPMP